MSSDGRDARDDNGAVCPSEFALERWRTGEMNEEHERRETALHVERCASCAARMASLTADPPPLSLDAVWEAAHALPPALPSFAAASKERRARRARGSRTPRLQRLVLSFSLVAVAAACLLYWPTYLERTGSSVGDLIKGTKPWAWRIIAKGRGEERVRDLASGARVVSGDRLRFEARTAWRKGYVAVLSFDSAGQVTPFVPAQGTTIEVEGGQPHLLGTAVELDDTPGEERLELFGCREAVPVASLVAEGRAALARAAGKLHALDVSARGCERQTFWMEKVKP